MFLDSSQDSLLFIITKEEVKKKRNDINSFLANVPILNPPVFSGGIE